MEKATKKNLYLDRPSKSRGHMSGEDKTWTGEDTSEHIYKWYKEMGLVENELRKYIREVLLEINLGTGVGIEYTAFVLGAGSTAALSQYVPEGWQPKSHHMTLISPKHQKRRLPSHWLDFEDTAGQMKVVAIAENDRVITGLVDLGGLPIPMKGPAFPHVTIAINPEAGGKAHMSNEFQLSDFESIKPIPITGAVEEILR